MPFPNREVCPRRCFAGQFRGLFQASLLKSREKHEGSVSGYVPGVCVRGNLPVCVGLVQNKNSGTIRVEVPAFCLCA